MEKRTIAEAAIGVLKESKQPMTAAEITQAILDKGLYSFNTKDPRAMVRGAIERRCEELGDFQKYLYPSLNSDPSQPPLGKGRCRRRWGGLGIFLSRNVLKS